ncbi:MAG: Fe-S cluster assembly protein SufD [Flavobacteriales bacterium]|nr:Fe-S cluster assembly protein SufD [Flavobacteriales bacterium]MCB9167208.1 Fe-S cluster assembly protein SufD [Flavobacteriales bacterium]
MSTLTATDPKATVLPLLEGSTWPGASEALAQMHALPVPTSKTEAWKYTRVGRLFSANYVAPVASVAVQLPTRLPFDATRVVFVNGHFRADLSDDLKAQPHVVIDSLGSHLSHGPVRNHYGHITPLSESLFSAMNTAAPTDGLLLLVFRNTTVRKPIHVLRITTEGGQLVQPRDLFLIQEGAKAEVIEEHITLPGGATTSLVNSLRECYVAEGAELLVHKLQRDGAAHISQENVQVDAKGHFSISTTTLEGSLVRNDLNVSLAGPGAHAELNGIYLLNGTTHCDNHTYIGHHVPDCTSDELYKGIVSDRATGVFNGKVYVKQDAQRTRAYQSNANILQGDHAKVYSKPELEIYADDVKCSHGCTIGRLDEKALFYLRSRGVSEVEARQLLAHAFTTDVLERIKNTEWKEYLTGLIDQKLDTL